jgi:hypothetical protein
MTQRERSVDTNIEKVWNRISVGASGSRPVRGEEFVPEALPPPTALSGSAEGANASSIARVELDATMASRDRTTRGAHWTSRALGAPIGVHASSALAVASTAAGSSVDDDARGSIYARTGFIAPSAGEGKTGRRSDGDLQVARRGRRRGRRLAHRGRAPRAPQDFTAGGGKHHDRVQRRGAGARAHHENRRDGRHVQGQRRELHPHRAKLRVQVPRIRDPRGMALGSSARERPERAARTDDQTDRGRRRGYLRHVRDVPTRHGPRAPDHAGGRQVQAVHVHVARGAGHHQGRGRAGRCTKGGFRPSSASFLTSA